VKRVGLSELKRHIEEPQDVPTWGTATPRLSEHVDGDGQALLAVTPLKTRPNYYVIRVAAALAIRLEENVDGVEEELAALLEELELEFGPGLEELTAAQLTTARSMELEPGARTESTDGGGVRIYHPWPALDRSGGVVWCRVPWPQEAKDGNQ